MNIAFLMKTEKENRTAYKRKELYILLYRVRKEKRVKSGQNRHKKRGTKKAPLIPGKKQVLQKSQQLIS